MAPENARAAAEAVFEASRRRRAAVGALSVEEKVRILVELQRLATSVLLAAGRSAPSPWQLEDPPGQIKLG